MYVYELRGDALKNWDEDLLKERIKKELKISQDLKDFKICSRSLDSRKKPALTFFYRVMFSLPEAVGRRLVEKKKLRVEKLVIDEVPSRGEKILAERPVIVGTGPGGLFCAYELARRGLSPIVLERGPRLSERIKRVEHFMKGGAFSKSGNIQFGEGGAGTFSDGKLTSRSKDKKGKELLKVMAELSGDETLSYVHNPHLGTDQLRKLIVSLRQQIEKWGGEFYFEHQLIDLMTEGEKVVAIKVADKEWQPVEIMILAIGHSSRDTFRMLIDKGFPYEKKPFSIGYRIEHSQSFITGHQYGCSEEDVPFYTERLGAAEYKLTYQTEERGIYSFCMCPGGLVMPSASDEGQVVTNGMSFSKRDSGVANSAIVATVHREEIGDLGIDFQEEIEGKAFRLGGSNYFAVGQNGIDFVKGNESKEIEVDFKPTYQPGITLGNLWDVLPENICLALKEGLIAFDNRIVGFMKKSFITGVETRTSSPLRFLRDENGRSLRYNNVYLCGEGAGYAGGIVSAGIDGMKIGEYIGTLYKGVKNS